MKDAVLVTLAAVFGPIGLVAVLLWLDGTEGGHK